MRSIFDILRLTKRRMTDMEDQRCHICHQGREVHSFWTSVNPSRRFLACPNKHCKDFAWMDPPMCERSVQITPGLLKRTSRMEDEIAVLKKKEKMLWVILVMSWMLIALLFLWYW